MAGRQLMINKPVSTLVKTRDAGDAAIDGLFGGLLAGLFMAFVLVLAGLLAGEAPLTVLERFSTGQSSNPLAGSLLHLAVSSIYGLIFSLLVNSLPRRWLQVLPGWLAGVLFAMLLFLLAQSTLLPALRSPLSELPWWVMASGHLVYGLVLGGRAYPKP
jgi:hypothetical protein